MNNLRKLFDTWQELTQLHKKQGNTILKLLAHPDTTPDMVQEAWPAFRDTRVALLKHHPVVIKALTGKGMYRELRIVEEWKP